MIGESERKEGDVINCRSDLAHEGLVVLNRDFGFRVIKTDNGRLGDSRNIACLVLALKLVKTLEALSLDLGGEVPFLLLLVEGDIVV